MRLLLILILPLTFIMLFRIWRCTGVGWRMAFLAASVTWAVWLLFLTEVLSICHQLTRLWIVAGWTTFCCACMVFFRSLKVQTLTSAQYGWGAAIQRVDGFSRILIIGIASILTLTLFVAIVSPPNTDDVMEYHLPRVIMWASNHSVQFFPVFDFSQLILAPWAEYAALHIYVLSGSDRFINLIEWFSFLGCIAGASLIARLLGAGLRGQILAAVLCATLPELILESTGSNNTAVGAYWIVAAVAFLLARDEFFSVTRALLTGASIGLAILTKGTAIVFLPPLLVATWFILRPRISTRLMFHMALFVVAIVLINLPQSIRNVRLTGSPMGLPFPEAGNRLRFRSEAISPSVAVSGVIRNAALHLGTPSRQLNLRLEHLLRHMIQAAGADPDDPRTTWRDSFRVPTTTTREYFAGNPGHFLLLCAVFVWSVTRWRSYNRQAMLLFVAIALGFVLFGTAMKWNLSGARYHLPLFILGTGILAAILPAILPDRVLAAIAMLALLTAVPFVLANSLRSLVPLRSTFVVRASRDSLYFADDFRESQLPEYSAAADEVSRSACNEIGIDAMLQTYVYPAMALIHERVPNARFQYAEVRNVTSNYALALHRPSPCVVVCLGCMHVRNKWIQYRNLGGRVSAFGDVAVFWPGGARSNDVPGHGAFSTLSAAELATQAERSYAELQSIPLPGLTKISWNPSQRGKLDDHNWQSRVDALSEIRLRGLRVWEWSEPLRRRGEAGTATPADIDTLETIDEALPQLAGLLREKIGALR